MEPTPPTTPPTTAPTPPPTPPTPTTPPQRTPPLPQLIIELRDLVITYFKQQTLVPIQQLGRYIAFGVVGSLLLGFGVLFLGLSGLRVLQTETGDTFSGDWSWVPYLIMFTALLIGGALVWLARSARRVEKEFR